MMHPDEFIRLVRRAVEYAGTDTREIPFRAVLSGRGAILYDPRTLLDYGRTLPRCYSRALRADGWQQAQARINGRARAVWALAATAETKAAAQAARCARALRVERKHSARKSFDRWQIRHEHALAWLAALDEAIANPVTEWGEDMRGVLLRADGSAIFRGKAILDGHLIHHHLIVSGIRERGFESANRSITKDGCTRNISIYRRMPA